MGRDLFDVGCALAAIGAWATSVIYNIWGGHIIFGLVAAIVAPISVIHGLVIWLVAFMEIILS